MSPYYQDDAVTLFHGDCREVDAAFDVVVTDPPYGISLHTTRTGVMARRNPGVVTAHGGRRSGVDHRPIVGDSEPFDPSPWLDWPCAFTGATHFAARLPSGGRWHVWDKTNRGECPTGTGNEFEMVWTSWASGRSVIIPILWAGLGRVNKHPDSFLHPTQKPVALFEWILRHGAPTGTVIDPFAGSGTTLVAAKNLGRRAVGVEIDEAYCEVAARRLSQEVLFGA